MPPFKNCNGISNIALPTILLSNASTVINLEGIILMIIIIRYIYIYSNTFGNYQLFKLEIFFVRSNYDFSLLIYIFIHNYYL
jgi:hypothetical protein